MKERISEKEKELLKKYYSRGISIEALVIATGYKLEEIKKILGVLKWYVGKKLPRI